LGLDAGRARSHPFSRWRQRRIEELKRAVWMFFEFLSCLRALHFAGLALRFFGSARFSEEPLIIHGRADAAPSSRQLVSPL
jgi:hypothetical protein